MSEIIVNRMVGTTLVVSVSNAGKEPRVRIIDGAAGPLALFSRMGRNPSTGEHLLFYPGWLCQPYDPRNAVFLEAIKEITK